MFARRGGRIEVVEYSELDPAEACAREGAPCSPAAWRPARCMTSRARCQPAVWNKENDAGNWQSLGARECASLFCLGHCFLHAPCHVPACCQAAVCLDQAHVSCNAERAA